MARPAASARRAGQWQPDFASRRILASRKKGEQNRRATHVISSSHRSLADLSGCYARSEDGVNQGTTPRQKEKIRVRHLFPPNEMPFPSDALQHRKNGLVQLAGMNRSPCIFEQTRPAARA